MVRKLAILFTALTLGGALLSGASWGLDDIRLEKPACPAGVGHGLWELRWLEGYEPDTAQAGARRLLTRPNFGATPEAAEDLKAGIVDRRLVATLLTVSAEHSICVQTFKEGHFFLPGVEDGPLIPEGYGDAGGLPNTHYYGRAADIRWVGGDPVEGNGTEETVLGVGRALAGIPPERRPDQIIGPPDWTRSLDYPEEAGWILAHDQLELHEGHLHVGYRDQRGTNNTR